MMPTRNRRRLLESAISSVQAQAYPHWELWSSRTARPTTRRSSWRTSTTRASVPSRPRGRCLRRRNLALNAADGDLIAYLDDDNRFDRQWLKAVALTFDASPRRASVTGPGSSTTRDASTTARAAPGPDPVRRLGPPGDPRGQPRRHELARAPPRPGALRRSLSQLGDWDLLLQLAAERARSRSRRSPATTAPTLRSGSPTRSPARSWTASSTTCAESWRRRRLNLLACD